MAAVVLNLTVYLVLSRLSALSMNVAGVLKDWLLIYLSNVLFHSPFTALQVKDCSLCFNDCLFACPGQG